MIRAQATVSNFRSGKISRVGIFALAELRGCEFSLKQNFASVDAKFHQDDSKISFDST